MWRRRGWRDGGSDKSKCRLDKEQRCAGLLLVRDDGGVVVNSARPSSFPHLPILLLSPIPREKERNPIQLTKCPEPSHFPPSLLDLSSTTTTIVPAASMTSPPPPKYPILKQNTRLKMPRGGPHPSHFPRRRMAGKGEKWS